MWLTCPMGNAEVSGERLRSIRGALQLNQTLMARLLGVTRQCVGNWENNRRTLDCEWRLGFVRLIERGLQKRPELAFEVKTLLGSSSPQAVMYWILHCALHDEVVTGDGGRLLLEAPGPAPV